MKRPEKSSETVQCFQQTCCSKNSVTLKEESDKNGKVASYEEHLTMKLFTMYITWRFKVEERANNCSKWWSLWLHTFAALSKYTCFDPFVQASGDPPNLSSTMAKSMSIPTWLRASSISESYCSRIGWLFLHPFAFYWTVDTNLRSAEVWSDRKFQYASFHHVWILFHTSSRFLSQRTDFVDILLLHTCTTTEENLETSLDGFQWHRRNWVAIPRLHLNIAKRELEGWFDILKNMHFQVAFSHFFTKASTAQASEYFYLCLLQLCMPLPQISTVQCMPQEAQCSNPNNCGSTKLLANHAQPFPAT